MNMFPRPRLLRPAALVIAAVVLALLPVHRLLAQKPVDPKPAEQNPASPTLADIAKKEEERRKALKGTGKVYTKEDLPKNAKPVPLPSAAAPAPTGDAKAEPQKPAGKDEVEKDENWWRGRMNAAREELRRSELFAQSLQSRINSLAADFSTRDDPVQRARIGEDRNKALAELERVTADVDAAKKKITDIEEEARQAGVPPGWIR